jgi:hypothetical protein
MNKFLLLGLAVSTFAFYGCSKSSTDTTASNIVDSIGDLPKITGAVTGNTSASSGNSTLLKDFDDDATWSGSGKSRPMCIAGSTTREILRDSATPDKTLCYVGKMESLGKFSSSIDDGNYHYYELTSNSSPMLRVKFKIVKTDGKISTYEMFTCQYNQNTSAYAHNEYTSVSITDGTASITSKNIGGDSAGGITFSWGASVAVTGDISEAGEWTSKVLNASRSYAYDGSGSQDGSFNQKITLTQSASDMLIDGYNSSSFYNAGKSGGAGVSTNSERFYAKTELVNASLMSTIAFGDGSAKAIMTFDGSDVGGAGLNTPVMAHWNGNTNSESTSDFEADVTSATPRADEGAVTVSFGSSETWDCAAASTFETADITISDMTTLQTCDEKFDFGSGEQGGANACFSMP